MKVYLVEDCGNSPGKIYAVFAHEIDADMFAVLLRQEGEQCDVVPRNLYYGQPPNLGPNP